MITDFAVSPTQYKVLMTLGESGALCQQRLAELNEKVEDPSFWNDPEDALSLLSLEAAILRIAGRRFLLRLITPSGRGRGRVRTLPNQHRARIVGQQAAVGLTERRRTG